MRPLSYACSVPITATNDLAASSTSTVWALVCARRREVSKARSKPRGRSASDVAPPGPATTLPESTSCVRIRRRPWLGAPTP
eukprot:CAMPEP_0181186330 /NCGR_PEP_ID=MMETSP1096-20121128/9977_1 /TAXON_ID=156174 ORGANISM="Chrysochromulina ericina, Strain CCMP281" /NCGR_SAMPLE_ID=MMETSP1096 /ASSEMBLY_ACC=CAM_ASM_000453 /LENGTH=81 /DNA_ID=CAMNT_0023275221 /DNA_START=759 /DNA_END=1001 /DNA_ORIENTATION=+